MHIFTQRVVKKLEKRIKVVIGKTGNFTVEATGFQEGQCHNASTELVQCLNGASIAAEEDRDELPTDDLSQYLNNY